MKTVSELLRQSLLEGVGFREEPEGLNNSFIGCMQRRIEMGYLRYGTMRIRSNENTHDFTLYCSELINLYSFDGNREMLVDLANFLMIEFTNPVHSNSNWKAEDHE